MNPIPPILHWGGLMLCLFVLSACGGADQATAKKEDHAHEEEELSDPNRIAIPAAVQKNLGMSFVKVERRPVMATLRLPGQFEFSPRAKREYRTMVAGQIELLVEPFDRVDLGTPLYRINAPAWRDLQGQLTATGEELQNHEIEIATFGPLSEAHERHENNLREHVSLLQARLRELEALQAAGSGRNEALTQTRIALAAANADLAEVEEKHVELKSKMERTHASRASSLERQRYLLNAAASLLQEPVEALLKPAEVGQYPRPRWASVDTITVFAKESGQVLSLAQNPGAAIEANALVLTTVRPQDLQFRARALQADLPALRDGLKARVLPKSRHDAHALASLESTMTGEIRLDLSADARILTVDILLKPKELAEWARPGLSAELEIVTQRSESLELAIPMATIQRDGLEAVLFRRDPKDPDVAIRLEADLGQNDGRYVELLSGVREGDEVVLNGAYQLLLATSGTKMKGGHFHADGTFHAEDH